MGQTLTHGVYLPDEGERNCYSGLAANWQILDSSVGTIAEHTTQIAGKANAVHTHTKSDITDFPAYGTTAGTICEGNDSRLSDARTPVAHTHGNVTNDGKLPTASRALISDSSKNITVSSVSDMELGYLSGVTSSVQTQLNGKANNSSVVHLTGNEIIEGAKTFTSNVPLKLKSSDVEISAIPSNSTNNAIRFTDKNNTIIADVKYSQYPSGNSEFGLNLRTKDTNNNTISKSVTLNADQNGTWYNFRPSDNSEIGLGSSNYRWKSVYSDSYYYGTTAWGLDKANVWTGVNTFQQNITYERTNFFHQAVNPCYILKDTELVKGSLTATHVAYPGIWHDKNGAVLGFVRFVAYDTGKQTAEIRVSNLIKNGALDPTGSTVNCSVNLELQPSGEKSLIPEQNNDINLGTSTNKWKSFNGVNPGALSLPTTDTSKLAYFSSDITDLTGGLNTKTFALDGWITIFMPNVSGDFIAIDTSIGQVISVSGTGVGDVNIGCICPVRAGITNRIFCKCSSALTAAFSPCAGSV